MQAITLLYHDVVPENHPEASGFLTPGANRYKLTEEQFRRHLDAIEGALSQRPGNVLDAINQQEGAQAPLITFDDGGESAYHPIADMLEERGWIGHFLITTDFIGTQGFVTPQQLRELRHRGHVIGSHTASHPARISACPPDQIRQEWKASTAALADILGEAITVASIPAGYYSKEVALGADASGIRALFSSEPQTRAWKVNNCLVLGRYCALQGTSPERVAAILGGNPVSRLLEYTAWNGKKLLKKTAGAGWLRFRARVLRSE